MKFPCGRLNVGYGRLKFPRVRWIEKSDRFLCKLAASRPNQTLFTKLMSDEKKNRPLRGRNRQLEGVRYDEFQFPMPLGELK